MEPYPGIPQPIRPSAVTDWIRCPRLWWLKEQGWEAPPSAWSPERLMGSAVHAGLACYWEQIREPDTKFVLPDPVNLVRREIEQGWPSDAPPEFSREGL